MGVVQTPTIGLSGTHPQKRWETNGTNFHPTSSVLDHFHLSGRRQGPSLGRSFVRVDGWFVSWVLFRFRRISGGEKKVFSPGFLGRLIRPFFEGNLVVNKPQIENPCCWYR